MGVIISNINLFSRTSKNQAEAMALSSTTPEGPAALGSWQEPFGLSSHFAVEGHLVCPFHAILESQRKSNFLKERWAGKCMSDRGI